MYKKFLGLSVAIMALVLFLAPVAFAQAPGLYDVEVGFITDKADAQAKCTQAVEDFKIANPGVQNVRWTGDWGIIVPNEKGSCKLEVM